MTEPRVFGRMGSIRASEGNVDDMTARTRLLGVMGWPVEHSLSPPMQNAAIEALGLDWRYVALPVRPEDLAEALRGARAMGFVGVNLTIPHKQQAMRLLDRVDPLAAAIGAVNTVHFTAQGARGYNTDADGYVRTVEQESGYSFRGGRVLQVGAGGVGRAMAFGAARADAASLAIVNRDPARARALAADLAASFPGLRIQVVESAAERAAAAAGADLIANATSLGMKPGDPVCLPPELIREQHVVFDTVYTPDPQTPLLRAARERGARCVEGLGMLARQGAAALRIWSGREPDEALMERVLRRHLGAE